MSTQNKPATIAPQAVHELYKTIVNTSLSPLERLKACDSMRRHLRAFELTLVEDGRDDGTTWEDVGDALGITKQAAAQRFTG